MANKMYGLVKDTAAGVPLGSTQEGANWCMKALNPAAPDPVSGLPDSEVMPRVVKHFERTFTVSFAAAAANWSTDIFLFANPWTPCSTFVTDGTTPSWTQVINSQLGASSALVRQFIHDNTEAYRIIYGSMTIVMDATTLTNSGLCVVSQYPWMPKPMGHDSNPASATVKDFVHVWPDGPRSYDALVQMPGSYSAPALDGVYAPLRMDIELPWVRSNYHPGHINSDDATTMSLNLYSAYNATILGSSAAGPPFGIASIYTGTYSTELPNTQMNVVHAAFRNLNPAANLRVTYRLGVEFLVAPNTTYSSDLRLPPAYDDAALRMYKIMTSRLKLAYPADYNDWQKILGTISTIAKTISPIVPGVGALVPAIDAINTASSAIAPVAKQAIAAVRARRAKRLAAKKK